jgi:hypothetical protein
VWKTESGCDRRGHDCGLFVDADYRIQRMPRMERPGDVRSAFGIEKIESDQPIRLIALERARLLRAHDHLYAEALGRVQEIRRSIGGGRQEQEGALDAAHRLQVSTEPDRVFLAKCEFNELKCDSEISIDARRVPRTRRPIHLPGSIPGGKRSLPTTKFVELTELLESRRVVNRGTSVAVSYAGKGSPRLRFEEGIQESKSKASGALAYL